MTAMDKAIDTVLELAREHKIEAEVLAAQRTSTAISFADKKMDQFSFSETRQLGVRVLTGKNEGVAYTESLDRDSLAEMLDEARANAKMIQREWVAELREAAQLPIMDHLYNPALAQVSVEQKIEQARQLESAALQFDARITNVPYARYGDGHGQMWVANTKGLRGHYQSNSCFAYARCLAKDGDQAVMAGEYENHPDFSSLDGARIAQAAARKTLARMGAVRPDTGRYTVVFENRIAEQLLGLVANYFSAKAVDDQTSPLAGKIGQKVFSDKLTLTDDPFIRFGANSRPFDDEGFASQKTSLIENGILRSFLTNSVLARKLKMAHTASAGRAPSSDLDVSVSNIVVTPGQRSLPELLGSDKKVIFVTDILGTAGFRAASGDFSIPIEGQLFEDGRQARPLKDFLMSGNILQLLAGVESVGNDALPPLGNIICPSLLVRDLNIAGRT